LHAPRRRGISPANRQRASDDVKTLLRRGLARLRDRLFGSPKVVDACIFFNELDLLELRFQELWDVVDRFVVVEATWSHAGAPKPLFFEENRERFAPYAEKVVSHALTDPPIAAARDPAGRAVLESRQRDAIGAALLPLRLSGRDVVLVSDVDEIPRASTIGSLPHRLAASPFAVYVQRHYHRYVNHAWPAGSGPPLWLGSVACRYRTLRRRGAHHARRGRNQAGVLLERKDPRWSYVDDGGWHLTWMGGAEAAWTKAQNVLEVLDKASGLRDLGPPLPIRAYPARISRDECRDVQARYLANAEDPAFTPLDFDRFAIEQDVPDAMRKDPERFRRWFFFTSGL
jgi:hypothetical protein